MVVRSARPQVHLRDDGRLLVGIGHHRRDYPDSARYDRSRLASNLSKLFVALATSWRFLVYPTIYREIPPKELTPLYPFDS